MIDEFEFYDAAYLLGALDDDDRVAYERHLAGCPECTARLDELRPTVGALRAARDAGLEHDSPVAPPPDLLSDLMRRAAGERRRRRLTVAGTGLLAAAAVVALLLVVLVGGGSPAPTQVTKTFQAVSGPTRVEA